MDKMTALAGLGALAHPIRLDAFRALVVAGADGLTPGALVDMLGVAYATSEQVGRNVVYRAAYPQMNALLAYLTENCCQGAACAVTPSSTRCGC